MKIITAATNKGGEGKTKLSKMLSGYFSKVKGKRGLAIDVDSQANFSMKYLQMEIDPITGSDKRPPIHPDYNPHDQADSGWSGRCSIADIFFGLGVFPYPTQIENLDIIPSDSKLLDVERVSKNEVANKVHNRLKEFTTLPEVQELYDYVIIDTPPSKGPLTIAAIKAATHLVIPAQMEDDSFQGIYGMLQLWKQETYARGSDKPINLVGILPNKIRNVNLHKDFMRELLAMETIGNYLILPGLKERTVYAEVDVQNAVPSSIFDLGENHIARREAAEICQHIYQRIFSDE